MYTPDVHTELSTLIRSDVDTMDTSVSENHLSNVETTPEETSTNKDISAMRKSMSPRKPEGESPSASPKNYAIQYNDLRRRYIDLYILTRYSTDVK